MSIYYFLACDEHQQYAPCCTGRGELMNKAHEFLSPFVLAHRTCSVRIISEHDQEADNYTDVSDVEDVKPVVGDLPPAHFVGVEFKP